MSTTSHPIFAKLQNPIYQAVMLLAAVLVFNLGAIAFRAAGMEIEQRFPWTIAASFLLFFAAMNAIMSIFTQNMDHYWSRSILSFIGLAAVSAIMAQLFSKLSMNEAGSYKWIYVVLTIGYLVFLLMLTAMRRIVDFAQKEEWNQPRLRQKRRS
ncbi:MAG: hypothetical protein IT258_21000 [Saprospiraceae bacterium]|nr:hypothetical protein [Saprospiraceae bacterium]